MRSLKKSLSLLLALVMAVSVMSVGAFAESVTCTVTFELIDDVGSILVSGVTSGTIDTTYTIAEKTPLGIYDGTHRNVVPYFTQTVNSGEVAKRPSAAAYYDYNVTQKIAGSGENNSFTSADSGAYTFDGWATEDGELYDFSTPVTDNLTLHPRFSNTGDTIIIDDSYTLYDFAREVKLGRKFNSNYAQGAGIPQTVQLSDNVTLTGSWEPIVQSFWGTFDGDHHSISGLNVNSTSKYAGFFSILGYQVTVKNLTFASPSVVTTDEQAGTLAGLVNAATITNVTVTNPFVSGKNNVGGLIGQANSGVEITNCSVSGTGTIQATEGVAENNPAGRPVGGLISNTVGAGTVTNCSVSGVTISGARKLGGLIGQVQTNANDAVFSCTGASVSNVTISSIATESFSKELTMGGLVGEFAAIQGTNTFSGTVSNINMTGPESIANSVYIMGLVSGGTSGTVTEAETAMQDADMEFNVTVSGTNSRTIETVSDYPGIMGTTAQTTTYVGSIKTLGANVGNTIYLNVRMEISDVENAKYLKYELANNAVKYFDVSSAKQGDGTYLFQIPVIAKFLGVKGTISLVDKNDGTGTALSFLDRNAEPATSVRYSVYDYLDLLEENDTEGKWLELSTAIRNLGNAAARQWKNEYNTEMQSTGWISYSAS